jgi:uncharacterized hydantoinase/oxoprolinase family protein
MAHFIYQRQILQIAEGLEKVYLRVKTNTKGDVPVVVTGLGKDFLAKEAAKKICADQTMDLSGVLHENFTMASPAVAVALMTLQKRIGGQTSWT